MPRMASSPLRAAWRALLLATITAVHVVRFLVLRALRSDRSVAGRRRLALQCWHRLATRWCRVLGFTVRVHGPLPPEGSLIAPNHFGYADVPALASICPMFLLTRQEFATAPVLGLLIRLSEQPWIRRVRGRNLSAETDELRDRLGAGYRVVAFLEGTSTGGDRVLPFMPSLVQAVVEAGAILVPTGVRWSCAHPDFVLAEDLSYWKDHAMGPHFWRLLGLQGLVVDVTFGEPIPVAGRDRKSVSREAREAVMALTGLPAKDNLHDVWPEGATARRGE